MAFKDVDFLETSVQIHAVWRYLSREVVVETQLPGDHPVRMVFNRVHVWVFDRTTEVVELQLQTRGFLEESDWENMSHYVHDSDSHISLDQPS